MHRTFSKAIAFCLASTGLTHWAPAQVVQVTAQVAPRDIGKRASDECPARLDVDFPELLRKAGVSGKVDFDSLHVVRAGAAQDAPSLPFRWYDADIPDPFPEFNGVISRTGGRLQYRPAARAGFLYNTSGRGEKGYLGFLHRQDGSAASKYVISFKLLPPGQSAGGNGPKGWIGDGQIRCEKLGSTTTGSGHTRIALDDWDGDGLIDIIQGEEDGHLFLFRNSGRKSEPRFDARQMLFDADGRPIDVGTHAAPLVTDFDGDGVNDLLVGTYTNRVVWYRNIGSNADRKLAFKGFVLQNGKPLSLPGRPVAGGRSENVFKDDYYPVLDVIDWDGDGRPDLLAGGYVTGRIYLYRNIGNSSDGTPIYADPEPLKSDGKIINVGDWCASPCAADLNGDGKLDLISGDEPIESSTPRDPAFLRFYQGIESSSHPLLTELPLPHDGSFPEAGLATPRVADLNGDGLLDLVVSAGQNIYIFYNAGTRQKPRFQATRKPLLIPWGSAPLTVSEFVDFNHDGKPDLFSDYLVSLNTGGPSPFSFNSQIQLFPNGGRIEHPSHIGDDWFWPYLCDLDGDGNEDVLFGDWYGTIWFHRNNGTDEKPAFDPVGHRLKTTDNQEIKVGPIGKDPAKDFDALQGARTVFAADDLDGDGLVDLAVADNYGDIRFYRNDGPKNDPAFEPAILVGNVKTRCSVDVTDWDGDGRKDIIAGSAGGTVRVYRNVMRDGKIAFEEGLDPHLPPLKQPRILMVDLNSDGDADLFIPSLQGSVWIERSYLDHGYAEAKITSVACKP